MANPTSKVNLVVNGVTTQLDIHDANAIPKTGSNQITGTSFFKSTSNGLIQIGSGTNTVTGGCFIVYGSTFDNEVLAGTFRVRASKTTSYDLLGYSNGTLTWNGIYIHPTTTGTCYLGTNSKRWKEIWCSQSSLNSSSDKRLKQQIAKIDDKLLDAWENVEPFKYKFNDAVETKGKSARFHIGYVSQDIQTVLEKSGVDASEYGFFLYDSWEEQKEISHEETYTEEVEAKSGEKQTVTKIRKVIDRPYREKGDSYGLRYTECLVVECKYLRRCIARLTARIEELEKGNNIK